MFKRFVQAAICGMILASSALAFAQPSPSGLIAIAAPRYDLSASVEGRPGQSPMFLLFDKQGKFIEAVANPYNDAKGNAGIPTVDFLKTKGVAVVVAGRVGSQIVDVMKTKGIQPVEFNGSVKDAVKRAVELGKKQ